MNEMDATFCSDARTTLPRLRVLALTGIVVLCGCGNAESAGSGDAPSDVTAGDDSVASDTAADIAADIADATAADSTQPDVPDTTTVGPDVPAGDATSDATTDSGAVVSDAVADADAGGCPAKPPKAGSPCKPDESCTYGTSCCCGVGCTFAIGCGCESGKWMCVENDYCLGKPPTCPDAGASDATDTTQPDTVDAGPPVPSWTHFHYQKGAGPCPPGVVCTWIWDVEPDGAVTTAKQGVAGTGQLSAGDLVKFNALIGTADFLNKMTNGFVCGIPPSDVGLTFQLSLSGAQHSQNVTGCAFDGSGDGLVVQSIVTLLNAY